MAAVMEREILDDGSVLERSDLADGAMQIRIIRETEERRDVVIMEIPYLIDHSAYVAHLLAAHAETVAREIASLPGAGRVLEFPVHRLQPVAQALALLPFLLIA